MGNIVLETKNLTKRYKETYALNDFSVRLEEGKVYGFVGNNGAGKTTFMRIISGLARQTSGSFSLFGVATPKEIEKERRRTGVVVEQPLYYGDMTAKQNLIAQGMLQGEVDNSRIDYLLDLVGLGGESKKVKNFSTGMKQRYGMAFVLMGNPEFLMLDEPFSGLDVEGLGDMVEMINNLRRERNITMLLSSHQLAKLHQVATDYIFIDHGEKLEEVTADELERRWQYKDIEDYFKMLVKDRRGQGG